MVILDHELVDLATPGGPMRTYLFRPAAAGRYPGIALFSEIFQVSGPMRRTAALLAGHGFVVAVPEIWHELEPAGTVLGYDPASIQRGNAHKTARELSSFDSDARLTLEHLKASPRCTGKLGVIGFCVGGHIALRAAMSPEVSAGACCYATDIHGRALGKGAHADTLDRLGEVKAEMLMIWGRQDSHIPQESRAAIHQAMSRAEVQFSWHELDAQHAFMRDEGPRYDPALARLCHGLVIGLLQRRLQTEQEQDEECSGSSN